MPAPTRGKSRPQEMMNGKPPGGQEHLPEMMGTEFIFRFYRLLKAASLYDRNNATIEKLTQEGLQTINPFVQTQGQLFLKIVRDNFFFNSIRIPMKADRYSIFKVFSQEMGKRMIGELEFSQEMEASRLKDFVFLLARLEEGNESNYLYVNRQLESRGTQGISVGKLEFVREEDLLIDSEKQKQHSKNIYFKSVNLVKEVAEGIRTQKLINIRKAKHLMQSAVNSIRQDESALLGFVEFLHLMQY